MRRTGYTEPVQGRVRPTGPPRRHPALRVLALLTSTPDHPDGCWTIAQQGRPQVGIGRTRTVRCARIVLEAKLGRDLLPGMQACHTCDHPPCIRPEHLFEGTQQDNARDMASKGRGNTAKLTAAGAAEIRTLALQGWVRADIARAYGVTPTRVSQLAKE